MTDVTVTPQVDRAVAAAHAWAGRLDVVAKQRRHHRALVPDLGLTDADWQQVIAVDLTSVFLVTGPP